MIEELIASDALAAAALWTSVGLTRPWNDPVADFTHAIQGTTSTVLGLRGDNELVGTVMVGSAGIAVGSTTSRYVPLIKGAATAHC